MISEIDILRLFYNEMKLLGTTRDLVFLSIDDNAVAQLAVNTNSKVTLEQAHALTDTCIANEWLERTTVDPYYNYLSLTEAGLQIVLASEYLK